MHLGLTGVGKVMSDIQFENHVKEAQRIIESTRFKYGSSDFFSLFIDHWAYLQTGMYEPHKPMPEDLKESASQLSHELAEAMKRQPATDVFAIMLGELGAQNRGGAYFPTPPHLASLMAQLLGVSNDGPETIYEPCVGTGAIILNKLEQLYLEGGSEKLKKVRVILEDLDSLMVKCTMIQIFHFLGNKNAAVAELSIKQMDTLTQREFGLQYYATAS